jgi:hypothetical protein
LLEFGQEFAPTKRARVRDTVIKAAAAFVRVGFARTLRRSSDAG